MFAAKRRRPSSSSLVSKPRKRQKPLEEINFDPVSRHEFLTGFHKRKQERTNQAKEKALRREKEARAAARKIMKQERQQEVGERMRAMRKQARMMQDGQQASESEEDNEGQNDGEEDHVDRKRPGTHQTHHETEYIDEDKYATVTVEEVNITSNGFEKRPDEEQSSSNRDGTITELDGAEPASLPPKVNKKSRLKAPKRKAKSFKYESKAERAFTKKKQALAKRAKADKRRRG